MPKLELLKKYAKLIVEVGANVQKDQLLIVRSSTETSELARLIAEAGYNAGAKSVTVEWNDAYVSRFGLKGMSIETLET
ncbi:MAG: aminopeptidase, partial [Candidatus Izemoplasma sp.]